MSICEFLSPDKNNKMLKAFKFQKRNWLLVNRKWVLPHTYLEHSERINNFKTNPDDVWILSYPRSGTTVMQELVWLLQNNMDFETASKIHLVDRSIFLERDMIVDPDLELERFGKIDDKRYNLDAIMNKAVSPQCVKSHLPLSLLPTVTENKCKVIYVARNPKSVISSWYEFNRNLYGFNFEGTFAEFCELFLNDLVNYMKYIFDEYNISKQVIWCPYWESIKEAWARRHQSNFLFLFYEEIVKDLSGSIKKVANFLCKAHSNEDIEKLANHLDFINFQKNPAVNNIPVFDENVFKQNDFIRRGRIDGWKTYFTKDIEESVDKWIRENVKDTDLHFPYFQLDESLGLCDINTNVDN